MKAKYTTTFILLIFLFNFYSCQTIVGLEERNDLGSNNTYYKDINNKLNPFEGTWIYDNGTDYIKFILVKKIKAPVGDYFEDILIGEFQYKHNGIEKINTLNTLNTTLPNILLHGIDGNFFWNNRTPFNAYTTDNFRLSVSINENDCISKVDMRTLVLNGQPAIQIYKRKSIESMSPCTHVIPGGFYYLIKQ